MPSIDSKDAFVQALKDNVHPSLVGKCETLASVLSLDFQSRTDIPSGWLENRISTVFSREYATSLIDPVRQFVSGVLIPRASHNPLPSSSGGLSEEDYGVGLYTFPKR